METDSFLYFLGLPLENPILFLGIFMVVLRSIIYYRMQNNNEMDNVEEKSENSTESDDIIQSPLESDQTTSQKNNFRGRKRGSRGRGQGKRFRDDQTPHGTTSPLLQTEDQTMRLILSRRSIFPKQFIEGSEVSDQDLEMILEAANWAPTHARHYGLKYEKKLNLGKPSGPSLAFGL